VGEGISGHVIRRLLVAILLEVEWDVESLEVDPGSA
jgi:hypothetical protein